MTRRELAAAGVTRSAIEAAVRSGALVRVRRGHYCTPDADLALQRAVRIGGQLACVSELRRRGVWVLDRPEVHVRVPRNAARLRVVETCVVHWEEVRSAHGSTPQHVSGFDAIETALGCLERRAAVAAVDSALHLGVISPWQLRTLPARHRRLLALVDPLAESGLESIVRVLISDLGFEVRSQVAFAGIGRVDLLVEGRVVVETDGDESHDVKVGTRDRRRDAAHVAQGRTVLRFRYAQVVYDLESVGLAIVGAVAQHRGILNSGKKAARARIRLARMIFS